MGNHFAGKLLGGILRRDAHVVEIEVIEVFRRNSVPPGNGKVIQLDRFLDGVSLSPIRQIEAYWTALREDGGIPMRSQIDPRGMSDTLEFTFILERIAPGMARFRIAGQHLCGLAGMEVRGMPLTAFFTPVSRPEIAATRGHVVDTPAGAELDLRGEVARTGAPSTSARMLMMPLKSDFGRVDRILGALMSTEGRRPTRAPIRFEVASVQLRELDGMPADTSGPKTPNGFDPSKVPPGFGEATEEFATAPRPEIVHDAEPEVVHEVDACATPQDRPELRPETLSKPADKDETAAPRPARPAWEDPALRAERPVDRFGTPRQPRNEAGKDAGAERPASSPRRAGNVPYLRLVKSDD